MNKLKHRQILSPSPWIYVTTIEKGKQFLLATMSLTSTLLHQLLSTHPILIPRYFRYKKLLSKAHVTREHLRFLKECLAEQVIRRSFLPDRLEHLDGGPFDQIERIVLNNKINKTKQSMNNHFDKARQYKRTLDRHLYPDHVKIIIDFCYEQMQEDVRAQKTDSQIKITRLIMDSKWSKAGRGRFFTNYTDVELPSATSEALGLGLAFAFTERVDFVSVAKDLTVFEKRYGDRSDIIRGMVYGSIPRNEISSIPRRYIIALKELQKGKSFKVLRADKSKVTVLMSHNEYEEKMEAILSDSTTYKRLPFHTFEPGRRKFVTTAKKILCMDSRNGVIHSPP